MVVAKLVIFQDNDEVTENAVKELAVAGFNKKAELQAELIKDLEAVSAEAQAEALEVAIE